MTAGLRQLYPPPGEPGEPDLARLYAYPAGAGAGDTGRPWVRAGMIGSADGAATVNGLSGGLSGPPDRLVFGLLRSLADVILVGAGTARAEHYRPARVPARWAALRDGRAATPPIAVLSGRLDLDLDGPLLAGTAADGTGEAGPAGDAAGAADRARTIVITSGSAPPALRVQLARRADLIIAGADRVDPAAAIAALAARGYRRILAEGGPHLLGQLVTAGLLDELCVTVSPVLAGGPAGRIIAGAPAAAARLDLAHVLTADGFLLCRYVRVASTSARS